MLARLVPLALIALLAACSRSEPQAPSQSAAPAQAAQPLPAATPPADQAPAFTRVADPSRVCMVNDQFMGSPQIPVEVEGKTYYGCCEMCQARLNKDPKVRFGRDPVTQRDVDKASAVIAKNAAGKVLYFESEESLRAYRGTL